MFIVSSTISGKLNPMLDLDDGANLGGGGESSSSSEGYLGLNSTPLRTFSDIAPLKDKVESSTENASSSAEGQGQETNQSNDGQLSNNGTEQQTQTQTPTQSELILGKFKDLQTFENAYKNLQGLSTRKAQEAATNAAEVARLQAEVQTLRNQQSQPPSSTETTGDSDMSDDDLELMLEDPKKFKEKLKSELIKEFRNVIEPDLKVAQQLRINQEDEQAWTNKALETAQAFDSETGEPLYPDFFDLQNEIQKAFELFPQFKESKDFAAATKVARMLKQQSSAPKPEDFLNDETFINKVVTNQQVQQKILQQNLKSIKDGAPPPQITSSSGTSSPAQPTEKPKSMKDASRRFLSRLGI